MAKTSQNPSDRTPGWIKLHKQILESKSWQRKPFDPARAFIDILLRANHKPSTAVIKYKSYEVDRGELLTSEVKLAERFGWSREKLRRWMMELKRDSTLDSRKDNLCTIVRVLNYDTYQDPEKQTRQGVDTANETSKKHQKNSGEYTSKEVLRNYKNSSSLRSEEEAPPVEQIKLGSHVRITQEQKDVFIGEDGEDDFNTRIQTINDYCSAHGKVYRDWAAAYRNFRKRDRERPAPAVYSRQLSTYEKNQEFFKKLEMEENATQRNGIITEIDIGKLSEPSGERTIPGGLDVRAGGHLPRRGH